VSSLQPENVCQVTQVVEDESFRDFLSRGEPGLAVVAEPFHDIEQPLLRSDGGDFTKWLRDEHPDIVVEIPSADYLVLQSSDVWLPLVFVATNIGLPVYLNLVSAYLSDRMKGNLESDKTPAHLSVEFLDGQSGSVKRLDFAGSPDSLRELAEKIDLNGFFGG